MSKYNPLKWKPLLRIIILIWNFLKENWLNNLVFKKMMIFYTEILKGNDKLICGVFFANEMCDKIANQFCKSKFQCEKNIFYLPNFLYISICFLQNILN